MALVERGGVVDKGFGAVKGVRVAKGNSKIGAAILISWGASDETMPDEPGTARCQQSASLEPNPSR